MRNTALRTIVFSLLFAVLFSAQATLADQAKPKPPKPGACDPSKNVCVGQECSALGVTTMDYDQKNIIACLKDDAGENKWKSMTSTTHGFGGAYARYIKGAKGDGQNTFQEPTWGACWLKNPLTEDCSCPSGFKEFKITGFDDRDECAYYNWPINVHCGMYVFACYN